MTRYKILHSGVGLHTQDEVVEFDKDIDTDRLLKLGAIEETTDALTDTTDTTVSPLEQTGSDTASLEAGAAKSSGSTPTGPAANPDNVQRAKDQAQGKV